jgi:hypothetical protein
MSSETKVCGCKGRPHTDEGCPDPIPEWLRERDREVAAARKQANREAAPLFGLIWSRDDEDDGS